MFLIGLIFSNLNLMLLGIIALILNNVIISLLDMKNNVFFLMFNITFFVLNIGGKFFRTVTEVNWTDEFSFSINRHTLVLLYISLLSVLCGKYIYQCIRMKRERKSQKKIFDYEKVNKEYVRKISKIFFYITIIISCIVSIEKIIYVQQNSYLSLFQTFSSKIPGLILKISETSLVFFLIYICTFPEKKKIIPVISIFLLQALLNLMTGSRGDTVLALFLVVMYFIVRQYIMGENYFNKKTVTIGMIGLIFLIIFLGAFNLLRNGIKIENFNIVNQFIQFFVDQETSGKVISYAEQYKNLLPDTNYNYTFGPFIAYFREGTIAKIINFGNVNSMKYNTVEMALYGNDFGSTISYLVLREQYLNGHGLGTHYIAELFTDYSYLGVIIYNIVLGMILILLANVDRENWIGFTYSFIIVLDLIYIHKRPAMAWVVNLLSIPNILSICMVYYGAKFIDNRRIKKDENIMDS